MKTLLLPLAIFTSICCQAQQHDFAWLEGTWRGPGFGGMMEEVWSKPDQNGIMMGMFRHEDGDGKLNFLEFWLLDSSGLKLRHFNPDMTAWEGKEDFVHFKMVSSKSGQLLLKGLRYRLSPDSENLLIDLDMKHGKEVKTHHFELKKIKE